MKTKLPRLIAFNLLMLMALLPSTRADQSYNVSLPVDGGWVAIANQLDHGSNTLDEVITNVPGGTTLLKWDCATQDWDPNAYTYATGFGWFPSDGTLKPGEGGFISAPGGATITFTGTPHVPVLPVTLSCGYGVAHFLSRQTNGPGTYENIIGLPPTEGAQVTHWNIATQGFFDTETYTNGDWSPGVPVLNIGEAALFIVPPPPVTPSYTINIQTGLNLIANQLDHGSNRLSQILNDTSYWDHGSNCVCVVPAGTTISKRNNGSNSWSHSTYVTGMGWLPEDFTLSPGEGAFLQSPTNFTITFTGTPHVPVLPVTIPNGTAYLLSRQTNDVGSYENIVGTSPPTGAKIYKWLPGLGYQTFTKSPSGSNWSPSIPSVAVGEAVWIAPAGGTPLYPPPFLECATNKTVDCGSAWTFDPPAAYGGCSTNITLTVLNTVTNVSVCPQTVTRTWLVTDDCGGSNTCSQTVSLQDTTPPVIACATNKVVSCVAGASANGFEPMTLRHFLTNATDGQTAYAGLVEGRDGWLYGTASKGGTNNAGTIFKLNKDGSGYAVLRSFSTNANDGQNPYAGLVEGRDGWLYGTTISGGTSNAGTVFKLNKDGSGYQRIANLGSSGQDGVQSSGIIEGRDGALYGTTTAGGSSNAGTVFKLNKDGSGYQRIANLGSSGQDGVAPYGGVVEGRDGALYGTTVSGGSSNAGTVFKLNKDGSGYQRIANLGSSGQDGVAPYGGLVEGRDGWLYGTTSAGGSSNAGTIFKLNTNGSDYQRIANLGSSGQDGVAPYGGLVEGRDGAMYGTTTQGGTSNAGTIFKLNKDGSGYQRIANLGSSGQDGVQPYGDLIEASDGVLYGTTSLGGTNNAGTVFHLNPPCAWSFDPPMATDACCGTNVTITVLSTTTNTPAAGAQTITRTWLATDCCSNTASCSQTVTVEDPAFPVLTQQPQSLTVTQGQTATFTLSAAGALPLTYAWYHNNARIIWATDDLIVVSNAQPADAGSYFCVISNSHGSVTSAVVSLAVIPDTFPPTLVSANAHCASNSVMVMFSEPLDAVSAGESFNYQISGGVNVLSATPDASGQAVALLADSLVAGTVYTLTVSDVQDLNGNTIAPNPASLNFSCPLPPSITNQPQSLTVTQGQTATFTIGATGTPPLSFAWFHNGVRALTVTDDRYEMSNVQPADAGSYFCVVSNAAGSVTSAVAMLTVIGPSPTNCCNGCEPPYPVSYSVIVHPNFNFFANALCRGTNTLSALLPNQPDNTTVYKWDVQTQDFDPNAATYSAAAGLWFPDLTLELGEGFALVNPGNAYTNTFVGCEPVCPLPCSPTNNPCQILGAPGLGTNTWTDLYSCPPACGTTLGIWNVTNQDWDTYTYLNGSWLPSTPYWSVGLAVKVCVQTNTNCLPCTNALSFTCPTNKTVEFGTAWTFDSVTASNDCCGTNNVMITIQSTVTNGICPRIFQRVWQITDCMTNIATCTQTVTVVDTTPPVIACSAAGQNLVPNPSFEDHTGCPFDFSQINFAPPWFRPTLGTPDYFNDCATWNLFDVPVNGYGDQAARTGQAYTGGHMVSANEYREYIEAPLLSPLLPGHTYQVSFYVALADYLSDVATDNLGAHFSAGPLTDFGTVVALPVTPQVRNTAGVFLSSFSDWMLVQGTFTAAGGETHITIGNFFNTANTPTIPAGSGNSEHAYYFVDDVSVRETCAAYPTNKTVNCDTNWSFDLPVAVDSCSGTNITVTVLDTVTNSGPCPTVITRTWLVSDLCSNSVTWAQTVTVIDSSPPIITCASNKTVECGTNWTFDPPTASDGCCTNFIVQLVSSNQIAGPCPAVWQGIWQAMDCCSNLSTCTQTVTVVDTTPPVFSNPSGPGMVTPYANRAPWQTVAGSSTTIGFSTLDNGNPVSSGSASGFFPSLMLAGVEFVNVWSYWDLFIEVGPNEPIRVNLPPGTYAFGANIGPFWGNPSHTAITLSSGEVFVHDTVLVPGAEDFFGVVSTAPVAWVEFALDSGLLIMDDFSFSTTTIDSGFAAPTAVDNCCTNVSVNLVSAVTNGPCPQVITLTWQATDCCSNTATTTRTVTVGDVTPPVLTCATNKTVECCASNATTLASNYKYTVLKQFVVNGADGETPRGGPHDGGDGFLYGMTYRGGEFQEGTVYKVDKNGNGFQVLHSFGGTPGDGQNPSGALIEDGNGTLLGCTDNGGGGGGAGTIFKIEKDGSGYLKLKSIAPGAGDGRNPATGLMKGSDGAFYGTTRASLSDTGKGTVFKFEKVGLVYVYTVLHQFPAGADDGETPWAPLMEARDGQLYGATLLGGSGARGTIFTLHKDGSGYKVLANFTGVAGDGARPYAAPIEAAGEDALYFTTRNGGVSERGTVFKLQRAGGTGDYTVLTQLKQFLPGGDDGVQPFSPLLQGGDGGLYGTAYLGGSGEFGTVFRMNADGSDFTTLKSFSNTGDGRSPFAGLIQDGAGVFYGTAEGKGGVVFKLEKEAPCGWTFDPPTATDDCCTNLEISVFSTVTNGNCPQIITRIWQVFDCSTNLSTCTQTVTVVDHTPPVIVGCSNIFVTIPHGQASATVNYFITATDSCSSPVTLTFTPPPGTFPVGLTPVTCVAEDACGNTSTCQFNVKVTEELDCPDLAVNVTATYPGPKLVHIIGPNTPCCGADFTYHIHYANNGVLPVSGATIQFSYPQSCSIVSITSPCIPPAGYSPFVPNTPRSCSSPFIPSSGLETFTLPTLNPGDRCSIAVKVHLCCDILAACASQQPLKAQATILPLLPNDCKPWNNVATLSARPCCSHDPNDCTVSPAGCGPEGFIHRDQALTYRVRFQNEGAGVAHEVGVQNILDEDLDLSTLEILDASHPYLFERNGRELLWIFHNIDLPSQNDDEDASQGFVTFRIRPFANAPVGTVINNSADVYFDANDPMATITTVNTVTENPVPVAALSVMPQPGSAGATNNFTYTGGTVGASHLWEFGPDATPQTSTLPNPTGVVFSQQGPHLVSLITSLGDCDSEPAVRLVTVGRPGLSIARTEGGWLLSWAGDGYGLQEADTLTTPTFWNTVGPTPTMNEGWYFVQLPDSGNARFYRLIQSP